MDYFSDRECAPMARVSETITPSVWNGIVALIQGEISTGAFGCKYPENCPDKCGPIGTDERCFSAAIVAEIPEIEWPLEMSMQPMSQFPVDQEFGIPDKSIIFDLIEFCYHAIAKPFKGDYHPFFQHYHLHYDEVRGKSEYVANINTILRRNQIAYELDSYGKIRRLGSPIVAESIKSIVFHTNDPTLNEMLEESRRKYFHPDPGIRKEAVERLWDCWERLKTYFDPGNKKTSVNLLLNKVSSEQRIRQLLEDEAQKLTDIGNQYDIRHKEISQCEVSDTDIVDYLFHRLFSLIQLLLRKL